ncbi:hypothetical protein OUHCRE12_26920 [Enterobacter kobei]
MFFISVLFYDSTAPERDIDMAVPPGNFQQNDTLNRYLLLFPRNANALNDVHSFTGEEVMTPTY